MYYLDVFRLPGKPSQNVFMPTREVSRRFLSASSSHCKLTHITKEGEIKMVDVTEKGSTHRSASASGQVKVTKEIMDQIKGNLLKKGDVLNVAKVAGILAAKKTHHLIPLCHSINLSKIDVNIELFEEESVVRVQSCVSTEGQTGVEMEALAAVSISCLTIYDMCKALSHDIIIQNIQLDRKFGGKRNFTR